ncbi:MAG: nitronate monooxygenase [Alkaliphilus sp.]|jgi:NAD(P)H-dependent flavin oxidoreductase YrpB (nitropropane dioxygenase family)|nr:nitronate monooxygenase [bacterium AH-315-G05]MBN4074360.1 nitronate monooxygenase [bacterium AH-315-E09]PHS36076.1 MAG: nitronate monooxygenase [Alkaliphilus sp.]
MILKPLKVGKKTARIPIIQGGMGVGVSLSKLSAAVANEGGIGVISAVQMGFREHDFENNNDEANVRALRKEIKEARRLSPEGIIGVNILVAVNNFKEMVKAAVEEQADLIIAGAGLPTDLPALVKGSDTKIAPIVSSGKVAALITKVWKRRYNYVPDLVIVEGPEAGGHLGFSMEQIEMGKAPELTDIVEEVIETLQSHEEIIPVIAAGGIFDGVDIVKYLKMGAAGVQIATRFVATHECDADIKFKEAYIDAKKEDIVLVKSPVGMPGRALRNDFVKRLEKGSIAIKKCSNCLKPCDASVSPYCISKALINAVVGDIDDGLIFVGSNAYKLDKIVSVKELMDELIRGVYNVSDI